MTNNTENKMSSYKTSRKILTFLVLFSLVSTQFTANAYWLFKEKPKKTYKIKYIIAGVSGLAIFAIIAALIFVNSDQEQKQNTQPGAFVNLPDISYNQNNPNNLPESIFTIIKKQDQNNIYPKPLNPSSLDSLNNKKTVQKNSDDIQTGFYITAPFFDPKDK